MNNLNCNSKGIYLAAFKAYHENYNITYQDINGKRDIGGDMLQVDLSMYDYIIATPPCNYYSRMNYRRDTSKYALATRHLLPEIIKKLSQQEKPFIVENVQNFKLFDELGLFDYKNVYVYFYGRHTYWTNIRLNLNDIHQEYDFKNHGIKICKDKNSQGGQNVHNVIERFLETIIYNKTHYYQFDIFDYLEES